MNHNLPVEFADSPVTFRQRERVPLALVVGSPLTAAFFVGELAFFRKAGFDVTLIAPAGEQLDEVTQQEHANKVEVSFVREIKPLADVRSLWILWKTLRRLRPTLLDYSDPKAALLGGIAGYLAGVPCRVYTMRGLRLETATGLKRKLLEWAERIACSSAHRVICNSHSLRRRGIELNLVSKEKAHVLGNGSRGIDQTRFCPTAARVRNGAALRVSMGIPPSAPVIGFAGRLVHDKGIVELVDAYRLLKARISDLRLVLIGTYETGDPVPRPTRDTIAKDTHILCPGQVRNMADYYQAIDVLALPTYREGFPSVVLEAQSAAKPVVTTFATGAIDSIVDRVTGLLVPVADTAALAKALETILLNKEYAARLGNAGRARILQDFGHEVVWHSLVLEYNRLIVQKQVSRPFCEGLRTEKPARGQNP